MGLPDAGPRECDQMARARLKHPRASSVFPTPIRPMLDAVTYAQACQIGETTDGRKLSKQTWAIVPKIKEVDQFIRTDTHLQQWVQEVVGQGVIHPRAGAKKQIGPRPPP